MSEPSDGIKSGIPILIVDDDPNDQIFLRRAFLSSGWTSHVAVVSDGEEATAYLRGADLYADRTLHPLPRLVVTDLKMPRMGGIDLLGWIAAEQRFNDLPVVVLTSSSDPAEVTKAFRFGAKGYLTKPVDFSALQDVAQVIMRYWVTSLVPMTAR